VSLSPAQRKQLKSLAHHLNPVVMIGQHGLRDSVIDEIDGALRAHELIKVRISGAERDERAALSLEIAERTQAEVVQQIGHITVLFRRNPQRPRITLA